MAYGVEGERANGKSARKMLKMIVQSEIEKDLIRKELQQKKLRIRVDRRAWSFKERLMEGRRSELTRRCWEGKRVRIKRVEKLLE